MAESSSLLGRALAIIGIGFVAWAGVVWHRSETIIRGQADLTAEVRVMNAKVADILEDFERHRDVYAHDGAREALHALNTTVIRVQDQANRNQSRADIHTNRITRVEERLREHEDGLRDEGRGR